MSEQMRELMNLMEDTSEYRLEGRTRVVVSGVDSSDGYAIEDILDEYGQVHEAEIRGRDLVAFVTFDGITEDTVESAIAALGYNSVSFDVQMSEQSGDTSSNDAAIKSGVLQMLARDNINTLADWNALSRREKYRYGDQASDLFYNHGWVDDDVMPDSAMFADMIETVLSDTNKSGNNNDSFSVAILSTLRREGVNSINDWKALPRNRRREIVSLTTDIFYNEGNWDGMEDYHAFEEIITDILLDRG